MQQMQKLFVVVLVALASVATVQVAAQTPPLGIPADWVGPWKQGDLLFGTDEPQQTYRQVRFCGPLPALLSNFNPSTSFFLYF
jgi:hypothetical protein